MLGVNLPDTAEGQFFTELNFIYSACKNEQKLINSFGGKWY